MAVLALDTATKILATAIGQGGETLMSSVSLIPRAHSRLLQPMAENLMKSAGVKPSELEGIVVGVGPGSYTGVRLGVTTAKAMAVSLDIPVYPVSTLAALAVAAVPSLPFVAAPSVSVAGTPSLPVATPTDDAARVTVLSLLYARRGRAFGGLYERTGSGWTCLVPPQVRAFPDWLEELPGRDCLLVHDFHGFRDAEEWLQLSGGEFTGQVPIAMVAPAVGPALLRLAHRQELGCTPRSGEDVHELVPEYALRVEAEVKQEKGSDGDAG